MLTLLLCVCISSVCVEVLDPVTDADNKASVKLDLRKLSLVLHLQNVEWENAIMCK